jgi:serine protease Do
MVGEPVIAIGNPSASNGVTTGVISAVDPWQRARLRIPRAPRTDAAINRAIRAGPLLNAEASSVDNAAMFSGAEGIGCPIPIEVARRVIRELLLYGEGPSVWLASSSRIWIRHYGGRGVAAARWRALHQPAPPEQPAHGGHPPRRPVASLDGRAIRDASQLFGCEG